MRIVIQKVTNGKVLFKDEIIREINDGHIFYVGIAAEDTEEKLETLSKTRFYVHNSRFLRNLMEKNLHFTMQRIIMKHVKCLKSW